MKQRFIILISFIIIALAMLPGTVKAQCNPIHTLPYSYNFDTSVFPPECWTTSGNGWSIEYWETPTATQYVPAPYSARAGYSSNSWLIMPAIILPTKGHPVLEFQSNFKYYSYGDPGEVLVSTTNNTPNLSTFTLVKKWTIQEVGAAGGSGWRPLEVSLDDFKGQTVYIAFRVEGGSNEWYIDDITVRVKSEVPVITTGEIANGIRTKEYSQILKASGSTTLPITWSIVGSLPPGLTLLPTMGEIQGTPTAANTYNFTVKATNSLGEDSKAYTMVVREPIPPVITTTSLPQGYATAGYKYALSATGDTPITWNVQSGSLPGGLSLNANTGLITGKPASAGTFNFTIRASSFAGIIDKAFSLVVNAAPTYDPISVEVINRMITNNGLSATLNDPANWSFVNWGNIPSFYGYQPKVPYGIDVRGLGLTGTIDLSGINEHLLAVITDPLFLTFDYSLNVKLENNSITGLNVTGVDFGSWGGITAGDQTLTRTFTEVVPNKYTTNVQFGAKPELYMGEWGYQIPIAALSYESGVITSTDYKVKQANYYVPAIGVASGIYILGKINFSYVMSPDITSASVPKGMVGVSYNTTLKAESGADPAIWTKTGGNLPGGLTLNPSGTITGTPTTPGDFTFTVTATNTTGATNKTFSTTIYDAGLEYDPVAVEVINNLITHNSLNLYGWAGEAYNEPSTWGYFATWNSEQPKKLTQLDLSSRYLSGIASFTGLEDLIYLNLTYNHLTGIDLTGSNPSAAYYLGPQFWDATAVAYVPALWNIELELKDVISIAGWSYGYEIPTGVNYSNGVIYITRDDFDHIEALLGTGIPGIEMPISINFQYSNLFDYDANAVAVINNLIENNNLGDYNIFKDHPISWEQWGCFLGWDYNTYPYQISWLDLSGRPITGNVTISGLLSMTRFSCDWATLSGLTVSNCPTMTEFYCSVNPQMTALNISGVSSLEYLHCTDNQISALNLTGCPNLKELWCQSNLLTNLDVTAFSQLQYLECYYNKLTSLNVSGLTKLERLSCYSNRLYELNLEGLDGLTDPWYSFSGSSQEVYLTLSGNAGAGYMIDIPLNTHEFGSSELTYEGGTLKSSSNTLSSTWFNIYTNKDIDYYGWPSPLQLSGDFYFEYEEVSLPPVIKTTSLPSCLRGDDYDKNLIATGDVPITWSVISGNLPDGLTLNANTGKISGIPTVSGVFNFTVKAANTNAEDTKALSIEIITPIAPTITTATLPPALLNLFYGQTLIATGDRTIIWEVTSGSLPSGLYLDSEGNITGYANTIGSYTFTVKASNNGGADTKIFTLEVHTVTYDPVAVAVINELIQNHGLNLTYDNPASWWLGYDYGYANNVTWDYSSPRQLIKLNLYNNTLTGAISLVGLNKMTEFYFRSNSQTTTLDVSGCAALQNTEISGNTLLQTIDLSGCSALAEARFYNCSQLTTVDLSGANALRYLETNYTPQLTTMHLIGCNNLEEIYISNTNISSIDVEGFTVLKWLFCDHGGLTQLNVNNCPSLEEIYVSYNNLVELDLTTCSGLNALYCDHNNLTTLNVKNLKKLEWLYCNDNQLTKLYLGGNDVLWAFDAKNNHLSELDYTDCMYFSPSTNSLSGQTVSVSLTESTPSQYIAALPLLEPTFGSSAISHSNGIIKSTNNSVTTSTFTVVPLNDMYIKYPQWQEYWGSRLSGTMTFEYLPASAPDILTAPLANGYIGIAYSHKFMASGLIPITWEILSGSVPNGLTLDEETGELSGIPTQFGTFTFTVKATNSLGSNTKAFTLVINDCAVSAFPFYEGFTSAIFPPRCWESVQVSGTVNWIKSSGYSESHSVAYHESGMLGGMQESWLITPEITIPATGIYYLEFGMQIWGQSSYSLNGSSVWVSTTGTDPQDFTEMIKTISGNEVSSNWVKHNIRLEDYAGQKIYIGFRYKGENAHAWIIGDVKVYEQSLSVASLSPAANSYNASITPTIRVTFNGAITANDLSNVTINGTKVTPTIDGTMLNIPLPADHLDFYTAYTVNIPANAIVGYNPAINWTFTTIQEPAQTVLISTIPEKNTRGIALSTNIQVTFNKNITSSNLSAITINGKPQTQTPFINGLVLTIPHDNFDYGTDYTVNIPANTINGYNADYSWTFTTECVAFTEFPLIEQFKTEAFPPDCWQHFQVKGTEPWKTSYFGLSGISAGISSFSAWDHEQEAWLVLPKVTLPASGNFALQFMSSLSEIYYYGEGSRHTTCDIFVSTQSPDPASGNYVLAKHLSGTDISTATQTLSVPLDDFMGNNVYIAFRYAGFEGAGWQVDDIYVYDKEDIDVELVEITTPTASNCADNHTVQVRFKNIGTMPIPAGNIQLELKVNGQVKSTETYQYNLPRWDQDPDYPYYTSRAYNFTVKADLSGNGEHDVTVTALVAGDRVPANSTKTKILSTAVSTFPWTEPFNSFLPTCWDTEQISGNGSWIRASDPPVYNGTYAVRRNNNVPQGVEQKTWLITRPVKVPTTGSYVLQFMSYIGNPGFYYTGAGDGRSKICVSTTTADPAQFQEIYLLDGDDVRDSWQKIRVSLAPYAGQTIYIGFLYSGFFDHEWRIDDVTVLDFENYVDAEVVSIIAPKTAEELTGAEQVKVLLRNNGGSALSGFNVHLYLGGNLQANEPFPGSIPSLGTAEFVFAQTLPLSQYKSYNVTVTVEATDDQVVANNSITSEVVNAHAGTLADFVAYRFMDDYDNDMSFVSFNNMQPHLFKTEKYFDPTNPYRIIFSGEYVNGFYYVYTALSNGMYAVPESFMTIIPETWEVIDAVSVSNLTYDMAYDYMTSTMFGVSPENNLVSINLEDGVMKDIGLFDRVIITIACNIAGELFVIDVNGNLCAVNKETAALTTIGSTGIATNDNIQTMAFHHQTGRLFWAALDANSNKSRFCEVNTTTGHATVMGDIAGNAQIFALYSPFETPVLVTKLTPLDGATQVALNSEISVNFNMDVTAADLTGITITPSVTGVIAKITNYTLAVAHGNFQYGTTYTVNIPAGSVENYNKPITWSFTTLPEPVPVQVVSTLPANNEINVALDAEVSVTFNQNVTGTLIGITLDGSPATATISGSKLTIAHTPFTYQTQHTVIVPVNAITGYSQQITWQFTTLPEPIPVQVVSTLPGDNATNVELNAEVSVTFNQDVTGTLAGITIDGKPATGTISGSKLTIAHDNFTHEKTYAVVIPQGAITGYNQAITWSFTTIDKTVIPTFTITASLLTDGGTINPIGATVVDEGSNLTFTITPEKDYNILKVLVDGLNNDEAVATGTYTFSNIVANHTIEASFKYVSIHENDALPIQVYSHLNVINVINDVNVLIKQVEVIDMLGRTIWQGVAPNAKTEIVLNVAPGIYAVRIITESTVMTSKVAIKF